MPREQPGEDRGAEEASRGSPAGPQCTECSPVKQPGPLRPLAPCRCHSAMPWGARVSQQEGRGQGADRVHGEEGGQH